MEFGQAIIAEQLTMGLIGCMLLALVWAFWLGAIQRRAAAPQAFRPVFWYLQIMMALCGGAVILFPKYAWVALGVGLMSCGGTLMRMSRQQKR